MNRIEPRISTASPIAALLNTDGYKLSHESAFPQAGTANGDGTGTTRVLVNWTNRSNKYLPGSEHAVVFGLQAFIQRELVEGWAPFFAADEDEVIRLYDEFLNSFAGPGGAEAIGTEHIRALHQLGYLPLRIKALREGTLSPMGVATLTIENTVDRFFWLPNYIETALSASIWHPQTTATIALEYRELLEDWAMRTSGSIDGVEFQAHDFSMRGQTSLESAAASGAGHLLAFNGSDSLGALDFIARYYPGDNGWISGGVPATEHSVMCIRGEVGESETFHHLLDTFTSGPISVVSDGFDFFKVLTEVLHEPALRAKVLARDGNLVIRPDSGDPVDIVCGEIVKPRLFEGPHGETYETTVDPKDYTPEQKGAVELLDENFGHTVNAKGYKVLNKTRVIYGDSITLDRARRICERLAAKGYATENVVFGIGSYTYQMVSRDSLGSALKLIWALVDGISTEVFKDPKTGDGVKKSAKGRIAVFRDENGEIYQRDQLTAEEAETGLLEPVWEDGFFLKHQSYADIRAVLAEERAARATRRKAS